MASQGSSSSSKMNTPVAPILSLPPELIDEISKLLPASSTASLALTCKDLYQVVRISCWNSLTGYVTQGKHRTERPWWFPDRKPALSLPDDFIPSYLKDRWLLLNLIKRDLPNAELCVDCGLIHHHHQDSMTSSSHAILATADLVSKDVFEPATRRIDFSEWGFDWGLSAAHLDAVVKRYRENLKYSQGSLPFCSLSYSAGWRPNSFAPGNKSPESDSCCYAAYTKLDVDPIVTNDRLMLHWTQRMWIPRHRLGEGRIKKNNVTVDDVLKGIQICGHRNTYFNLGQELKKLVRPKSKLWKGSAGHYTLRFLRKKLTRAKGICGRCSTEFMLTVHQNPRTTAMAPRGCEIICEVWQNMAEFEPLDNSLFRLIEGWRDCWDPYLVDGRQYITPQYNHWWDWEEVPTKMYRCKVVFADEPSADEMMDHWARLRRRYRIRRPENEEDEEIARVKKDTKTKKFRGVWDSWLGRSRQLFGPYTKK